MSHYDAPSVDEAEASVCGILLVTATAQDRRARGGVLSRSNRRIYSYMGSLGLPGGVMT
jgi:hypothetical protein